MCKIHYNSSTKTILKLSVFILKLSFLFSYVIINLILSLEDQSSQQPVNVQLLMHA